MHKHKVFQRQGAFFILVCFLMLLIVLFGRISYLMLARADHYGVMAKKLHERERSIKAERGKILDRNGEVLAGNTSVSTISVIHSQVKEPKRVVNILCKELGLSEKEVTKKVNKVSSREKIKSNVEKKISDRIRKYNIPGIMVDEDYRRDYKYEQLASKVIGFTGADNQGIIGLEVSYDKYLKGIDGSILTMTTAHGTEIKNGAEDRVEPISGWDLNTSLDVNLMKYASQTAETIREQKQAKTVEIILMNPQNGEIYAMVSAPEFDLNQPFKITENIMNAASASALSAKGRMDVLNNTWRNLCVSDTYEPGSTFKVLTMAAALEKGVVKMTDHFSCPGYRVVENRRIRCHKTTGHGSETFLQGVMNSCNPVFIDIGARVGISDMFRYLKQFGALEKTGIDVPGEAKTIMHQQKNVKAVELATISFGQSFQMTQVRLLASISSIINGGHSVTPHFGVSVSKTDGSRIKKLRYPSHNGVISEATSKQVREALAMVVSEGTGRNAAIDGYAVGAKTGTSEKLPRGNGKYIASCVGFAPANNPKVIAMVRIDEPVGIYYGGTIAAPAISTLLDNAVPYLLGE